MPSIYKGHLRPSVVGKHLEILMVGEISRDVGISPGFLCSSDQVTARAAANGDRLDERFRFPRISESWCAKTVRYPLEKVVE